MRTWNIMQTRGFGDLMDTGSWDFPPRADTRSFDGGLVIKGYVVDPTDIEALNFLGEETARAF